MRSLVCPFLLVVICAPALAQQKPAPQVVSGQRPAPETPPAATPARKDEPASVEVTPLGTPLSVLKQELEKPAPKIRLAHPDSVATFRVTVTPDYQAEFQRRLRSIFDLGPEDRTPSRTLGRGVGFDPVVFLNAYRSLMKAREARQARKEVQQVLEEFRRLAAAEQEAAAKTPALQKPPK